MIDVRAIGRRLVKKSPRQLLQHAARRLGDRLDVTALDFPLLPEDVADSQSESRGAAPARPRPFAGGAPRVGWLVVPPGAGSGGHTTLFRMMAAAHGRGVHNTLLFYDRYRGDHHGNAATVRRAWPWLEADIEPVGDDLSGYDAVVASSWPTAHVAARRRAPGQPALYFIQDFEPYFYPRGSMYALAEDSYRLGLVNVALGRMVAGCLRSEVGIDADAEVPFGCDAETYRVLDRSTPRRGVLFYAKPGNDRRGHRLAVCALELFHRRHPEEPIHVYGDAAGHLPFPVVEHGSLSPAALNELYNTVVAGFALSFTNISLVAEEMLAAGVVPIVNDSPLARADLDNPHVAWAHATAAGLASALHEAVARPGRDAHARAVAESVTTAGWDATGARFVDQLLAQLAPRAADATMRTESAA